MGGRGRDAARGGRTWAGAAVGRRPGGSRSGQGVHQGQRALADAIQHPGRGFRADAEELPDEWKDAPVFTRWSGEGDGSEPGAAPARRTACVPEVPSRPLNFPDFFRFSSGSVYIEKSLGRAISM